MRTIYRYHQSWKHKEGQGSWRVLKKLLMQDPGTRQVLAGHFGVSGDELLEAVKGARNRTELKSRLGADGIELTEDTLEDARELELAAVVRRLRGCPTTAARKARLVREARRIGTSPCELLLTLAERNRAARGRRMS